MTGAARPTRTVRIVIPLVVAAMLFSGIMTVWNAGAGAQDGTDFAGTAVATHSPTPFVAPTPTPTPEPIDYEDPAFVDGLFRIVLQRTARGEALPEFELSRSGGREWIVAVVDVINFSTLASSVSPARFRLRLAGGDVGNLARQTTERVARGAGLSPRNINDNLLLQPGDSMRFLLVFQIDAGAREPALVYQFNALPLATRLGQQLDFDDLPPVASAPRLTPAFVTGVVDARTVTLGGEEITGDVTMAGVDPPRDNECFAAEAKARLESIIGFNVLVEEPEDDEDGIFLWLPFQEGQRILVNHDMIISGHSTSDIAPGSQFADWLNDSLFVAKIRTNGLWGRCTSPHGVNRPNEIERVTFDVSFDGRSTEPYIPWVDWSPVILALPNAGAIAFFSAQREPDDPATPIPASELEQRLFYSVYDPDRGRWSVAQPLPEGGRLQFGVSGVVDSQGRVHIVFSDRRVDAPAALSILKYMVREVDGSWSRPVNVAPNSRAGHQISPSLAIDADDTLYVVWQDQRRFSEQARAESPAHADVFFTRKPARGDWATAQIVNEHNDAEFINRPLLAVDGDRLVAVWSVYRVGAFASATRVDWSHLAVSGEAEWNAVQTMIVGRGEAFGGRLLDLASDPTGGVIFVFGRQNNDTFLFLRRLPALASDWESDILLTYGDRGAFPAVTVAVDGTVYVVYGLGFGNDADVAGVGLLKNSIAPGPEVILTGQVPGAQGLPGITTDATGLPWVIYYSQPPDGTPNAVEAIRNFLIPRSQEELEALIRAAGGGD